MRFSIFSVADHYPEELRTIREVMPNFVESGFINAS